MDDRGKTRLSACLDNAKKSFYTILISILLSSCFHGESSEISSDVPAQTEQQAIEIDDTQDLTATDIVARPDKKTLLNKLEQNQNKWSALGAQEYDFSLHKQCDNCPEDINPRYEVKVSENDDTRGGQTFVIPPAAYDDKRSPGYITDSDYRINNMESYFSDVRQAILQGQVSDVNYDTQYGYPQTVYVSSQRNDDQNHTDIEIHTNDFHLGHTDINSPLLTLNGTVFNSDGQYWLIEDNGRWIELQIPETLQSNSSSFTNNARVQVVGQWAAGGRRAQGHLDVNNILIDGLSTLSSELRGVLAYSPGTGSGGIADGAHNFQLNDDFGSNTKLMVAPELNNLAFTMIGQKVKVTGNWVNHGQIGAHFSVTAIKIFTDQLEQFFGTIVAIEKLYPGSNGRYFLSDDMGQLHPLRLRPEMESGIATLTNRRVSIAGVRHSNNINGQTVIEVHFFSEVYNLLADIQITGRVNFSAGMTNNGLAFPEHFQLQLDNGNTINVYIPISLIDPNIPLHNGLRIKVVGFWNNSRAELQARLPIQILGIDVPGTTRLTGRINNIGNIGDILNCNAQPLAYGFFDPDSQQYLSLVLQPDTTIIGAQSQNNRFYYSDRVEIYGLMTGNNTFLVDIISLLPSNESIVTGFIESIGPISDSFSCLGPMHNYTLRQENGSSLNLNVYSSSNVESGALQIGRQVRVSGVLLNDTAQMLVRRVEVVQAVDNAITMIGTVIAVDCTGGSFASYYFVGDGQSWQLEVPINVNPLIYEAGATFSVTGIRNGSRITASLIEPVAQGLGVPPPINVKIVSLNQVESQTCGAPVYHYAIQDTSSGQLRQLRISTDVAGSNSQPFNAGTQFMITRWLGYNNGVIDALSISFDTQLPLEVTLTGTITAVDCALSNTYRYYFIDESGNAYKLMHSSQGAGFGSKVQISGTITGDVIHADQVIPIATPAVVPPTIYGTINNFGAVETVGCIKIYNYNFITDDGITKTLRVSSQVSNISQPITNGTRLAITNRVLTESSTYIDALVIEYVNDATETIIDGAITALNCTSLNEKSYRYVTTDGRVLNLHIDTAQSVGTSIGVGSSLRVTGNLYGSELYASSIIPHPINNLPYVPPPLTGFITGVGDTVYTSCGQPIYTYLVQTDSGETKHVHTGLNAMNNNYLSLRLNQRVEIETPIILGASGSIVEASSIKLAFFGTITSIISEVTGAYDRYNYGFVSSNGQWYQLEVTIPGTYSEPGVYVFGKAIKVIGKLNEITRTIQAERVHIAQQ